MQQVQNNHKINFSFGQNHNNQEKQVFQILQNPKTIKKKQKRPCIHWSSKENLRYLAFLISNKADLTINSSRKIWKIYKLMSEFIPTRDIHQCRSHHQKMVRKHQDINELIEELKLIAAEKPLVRALKEYSQHFLQKTSPINQKFIKLAAPIQRKSISNEKKEKIYQNQQLFEFEKNQDNDKQQQKEKEKIQPIIKKQQSEQLVINQTHQYETIYQFMPSYYPFVNPASYYHPSIPYFFIYHQ